MLSDDIANIDSTLDFLCSMPCPPVKLIGQLRVQRDALIAQAALELVLLEESYEAA